MKKQYYLIILPLLTVALSECNSIVDRKFDNGIAATAGDRNILLKDVDSKIQSKIYESLFHTYYARKLVIDDLIGKELLREHSTQLGIDKDSLISIIVHDHDTPSNLRKYIVDNHLLDGVPDPDKLGKVISLESEDGKKTIKEFFHRQIINNYVDSLRKVKGVDIFITPPKSPAIDLSSISYNLICPGRDKGVIWIFSDISCTHCREFFPTLSRLVQKYGRDIEFRYTPVTADLTEFTLLAEYTNGELSFWPILQDIYLGNMSKDSLFKFHKIDNDDFRIKIPSLVKRITENNRNIKKLNLLTSTPTIVINNRIYYGDISFYNLDKYVESQINDM